MEKNTQDNITIEHHSTASVYKVVLEPKNVDETKQEFWLDYAEFDSLVKLLNRINLNS